MPYLIKNDYKSYIQGDYLRQLVQGDDSKRINEENVSLQAIMQRLQQRYDLDNEFTETLPYDKTKTYTAGNRVVVDVATNGFQMWVASTSYNEGDLVIYDAIGYICQTANSDSSFNIDKWSSVGAQYDIYYALFPASCTVNGQPNPASLTQPYAPVFNYKQIYTKGDIVYWKGYTYTCNQNSTVYSHWQKLQFALYSNIPYANVFPDDPVYNNTGTYWTNKEAYTISAGTPLTDNKWTKGDNRNQTIKDAMVRITVFKLSPLIAPKNRPDVWLDDYRSILRELNEAAMGQITMNLPPKQPQNNLRTYYGGYTKNVNNY